MDTAIRKRKKSAEDIWPGHWGQYVGHIKVLYDRLYSFHPNHAQAWQEVVSVVESAFKNRAVSLKKKDSKKTAGWFLSNEICGMSLYVDRFCSNLSNLENKLDYFKDLGINFLHLMPLFDSPESESDGGYAVSDFRKVNPKFGNLADLRKVIKAMGREDMYLMLDIVLNHTSDRHEWAQKAKAGEKKYQQYFYMFDSENETAVYAHSMPEVFPEAAPGNFTYVPECNKWVMSVFHNYQWDLNYTNPYLFAEMLDNIFFYANLGVDMLRIDAPAFIWKRPHTTSQNLAEAHTILKLIKQCVQAATPGMALLAEAIVAPKEIMKYFGESVNGMSNECDVAYNATHMALQWDALASGNTHIMLAAQYDILQKPSGTTWINYTRCHDDIGLAYDDWVIEHAGLNPFLHRKFVREYFTGQFPGSWATGALFSSNIKTGDARISGTLASLCGLEKAMRENNTSEIEKSISKILLMQAHCFFLGGIPMLYYGDERASLNDYSYMKDEGKHYDNRWMHRPLYNWDNIDKAAEGTPEMQVYHATQKLLVLRKKLPVLADRKNITWLSPHNIHIAGYVREWENARLYCLFNFSNETQNLTWYAFKENGMEPAALYDYWSGNTFDVKGDNEYFVMPPYSFFILEPK